MLSKFTGRPKRLLGAIVAVGLAAQLGAASPVPAPDSAAGPAERAQSWYASLQKRFAANDGSDLYREYYPARASDNRYSFEWPFSQVHIAALDLAAIPGPEGSRYQRALAREMAAQQHYWSDTSRTGVGGYLSGVSPPLGRGDDLYYDDNEWVGLAAVQHWLFFHDDRSLTTARRIFALVRTAWDDETGHPAPGGLFWTQKPSNHDRNTVSNMPAAELGLRLAQITHDPSYFKDALRYYRWTNRNLQRPDGLYEDHLDLKGIVNRHIWSYNQGVPVGVNVLLYQQTGDAHYLAEAQRIADASYRYFIDEKRIDDQPAPFNAIYFKNLLLLEAVTGDHRYSAAMRAYADRMWRSRRDGRTGLLKPASGRAPRRYQLIDQAAMVQIGAVLAWTPADYSHLY